MKTLSTAIWFALLLPCHAGKIHDAVAMRDVAALERVLKTEPKQINSRCYPDFRTPLHMAVAAGDPAVVKLLLDAGADPALSGPESLTPSPTPVRLGETPLQRAVDRSDGVKPFPIEILNNPNNHLNLGTLQEWTQAHQKAASAVSEEEKRARLEVLALLLRQKPALDKGFVQGLPPLHSAAALGDIEAIRLLIGSGADVNGRSGTFWLTPLHFAAMSPGATALEPLIAAGARVERTDRIDRTPLMFAAFSGSLSAVKTLVAHRARLDAEDIRRNTVIGYAAAAGHDDLVKFIYQKGGRDLIRLARHDRLFANAASGGNRQLVDLLLAEGVDVDTPDENGATPLLIACESDDQEFVRFLIGKGADKAAKSKSGTGLFRIACIAGHTAIAKELLADQVVTASDSQVLIDAAMAGCVELVEDLIEKGAVVNAVDKDGRTPLTGAIRILGLRNAHPQLRTSASEDDYADVVELLLKHGAKVNHAADNQPTPVHLAAQDCGARIMKALLKAGGNPTSSTGADDRTPLQIAAAHGRAETVRVLLDAGADPKQVDHSGYTLMHLAANEGNAEVVKLLIGGKLPVNAKNQSTGETPLHSAVCSNSLECVRLLLVAGADPNAVGPDHLTALPLAIDIKDMAKIPPSGEELIYWQRTADLLSRLRIIHELIEAGASTTVVPAEYKSLAAYAQDRGCPEITELLENPPPMARKPVKR